MPFVRLIMCALCVLSLPGCLAASSSSSYETGRQVTSATIDKITIGQTTENWLLGTLGEPTNRQVVAEGVEVVEEGSAVSGQGSENQSPAAATEPRTTNDEPTRKGRVEILRYDWSRREESGGAFFLIFAGSETKTERSSAWFEITDGVVTDYGVE